MPPQSRSLAISGRDEIETANALDTLAARQLIAEASERYIFAHTQVAEVAYGAIGATRRRLLHGRAAGLLADVLEAAALVAAHLERAGRSDEAASYWLKPNAAKK